jgi:hypothetical protein
MTDTHTEALVERVARALYEVSAETEHGETWESLSDGWKDNFRTHARAAIEALPARNDEQLLPCDVRLPPATTITAGCSVATLLSALETEGRPRNFPARNDERALKLELEPFPMLNGEPAIPYYLARIVYEAYGTSGQSLERIKERGGFGWAEVSHLFKELRRKNERLHKALREQSFAALADTQPSGETR